MTGSRDVSPFIVIRIPDLTPRFLCPASVCSRLGMEVDLFRHLDLAFEQHDDGMHRLLEDDCWDPHRGDPRFIDLLRKVGYKTDPHRPGALVQSPAE